MARRVVWWLAVPLLFSEWLTAQWLAHLVRASDAHETAMAGGSYSELHLCGACALMLVVLVVVVLGQPVLALGFEQGAGLRLAPRPPFAHSTPLRLVLVEPERARPSVLACGHVVRAPPGPPMPV